MQNLDALLKSTTTPTKEKKKRSQLGPLLNALVIAEWVESIAWKVSVLVLAIVFGQSINISIANTFYKYC